ncbi:MAG: hypothetical protein MPK75_00080 [Alphaproteobacteria bacterium]|nr:hypothetical protein [Alphaproteobacteria bacterium]
MERVIPRLCTQGILLRLAHMLKGLTLLHHPFNPAFYIIQAERDPAGGKRGKPQYITEHGHLPAHVKQVAVQDVMRLFATNYHIMAVPWRGHYLHSPRYAIPRFTGEPGHVRRSSAASDLDLFQHSTEQNLCPRRVTGPPALLLHMMQVMASPIPF